MQVAGSGSWRFEEGQSQLLDVALYVRDDAGLTITPAVDVPPPLDPPVTAQPRVVGAVVAEQWTQWWRTLIAHEGEVRTRLDALRSERLRDRVRAMHAFRETVCDPPDFASMRAWPELRELVSSLHDDAIGWTNQAPAGSRDSDPSVLARSVVRDAAEHVAAQLSVPISSLDAGVQVLPVSGSWSCVAGPGLGMCSTGFAIDATRAAPFLRHVFASSLER